MSWNITTVLNDGNSVSNSIISVNTALNGIPSILVLISIWSIFFISFKNNYFALPSAVGASFITTLVAISLSILGMLHPVALYICIIGTAILVATQYLR